MNKYTFLSPSSLIMQGYYSVYRNVFAKIAKEDIRYMEDEDSITGIPSFGESQSSYEEVSNACFVTGKPSGIELFTNLSIGHIRITCIIKLNEPIVAKCLITNDFIYLFQIIVPSTSIVRMKIAYITCYQVGQAMPAPPSND